jgi:hypothetical protein
MAGYGTGYGYRWAKLNKISGAFFKYQAPRILIEPGGEEEINPLCHSDIPSINSQSWIFFTSTSFLTSFIQYILQINNHLNHNTYLKAGAGKISDGCSSVRTMATASLTPLRHNTMFHAPITPIKEVDLFYVCSFTFFCQSFRLCSDVLRTKSPQ